MNNKLLMFILISAVVLSGCSNPFRKKSQCEIICEQMHGECSQNCQIEGYDPVCQSRCDTARDCRDTCDKPLFREGVEKENPDKENTRP